MCHINKTLHTYTHYIKICIPEEYSAQIGLQYCSTLALFTPTIAHTSTCINSFHFDGRFISILHLRLNSYYMNYITQNTYLLTKVFVTSSHMKYQQKLVNFNLALILYSNALIKTVYDKKNIYCNYLCKWKHWIMFYKWNR